MISNIRKSLNRKYLRVIVWFLLLALFGLPSVMGLFKRFSQPTLNSIAEVDGYHIDSALYKRKVAEEERRLQFFKQFGAQAEELLRSMGINGNAQELALNSLIQDALIHNCAEKLGIRLSSEYINNKLQDPSFLLQSLSDVIPPALFNETGVLDPQVLARYLQRQGIAMSDFEKIVEDTIQKDIVFKIVQGGLYVPGALIKNLYAQEYSKKKFLIVSFSKAEALQEAKKEVPSDEQLKKFFADHNARNRRYWVPEKRTVTLWSFNPGSYGIAVTEKEIKNYYNKNKSSYEEKDLAAATPAIKELLQKEKFKRLFPLDAQRILASSKEDSQLLAIFITNKGGQKTTKIVGNDQSALMRKAFSLQQGQRGFVHDIAQGTIVSVDSVEATYLPSFESIKTNVLRDYYENKAQELMAEKLMNLKENDSVSKKQEVTGWLDPQKPDTAEALKKQGLPLARMFRMTHKGDFIDAVTPEYAYAIRLEEIEPLNEEQFNDKKAELVKVLLNQTAQQIAQAFVASLQKNATIIINKTIQRAIN